MSMNPKVRQCNKHDVKLAVSRLHQSHDQLDFECDFANIFAIVIDFQASNERQE